jgi:Uncharacterised nucleotidyltransferase/Transglutaminase-like superfamily
MREDTLAVSGRSGQEVGVSAGPTEPPGLHDAMRTLRIDAATGEVVGVLRAAGVPSILLKGPSVARWIYDKESRPYGDCDLLVRRSDLEVAEQSLRTLGFERGGLYSVPGDWPRHAVVYQRGDVTIDLHQTLLGVRADADRLWGALAPHREPMRIAGAGVDVLDAAGRAFVLALHSAKDGGRSEKPRRDLERALDVLPLELWEEAAGIAAEVGAVEAFAAGLRRCPAGREVAGLLGLSSHVSREIALRRETPAALSAGVDWLLRSKGFRVKVELVARKMVPPPEFLRAWSPLARRGRWGLALAYVWRPVWLVWRAPAAVWDVFRASSRARGSGSVEPAPAGSRLSVWSKAVISARIWWTFVTVIGVERRHPLPQAAARLGVASGGARIRVEPRRLGRLVGRVLRFGRWRPRCLFSALVLFRLLRQQGDDAELVIGMPLDRRSKDAHAWVEAEGVDVGPPPGGRGRLPLARYPLRPPL